MPQTVIIQYVPDAATDERINIGVSILCDDNRAVTNFITDWHRVKQFAGRDIQFLKDLRHESRYWDAQTVARLAEQSTGSIQFATPRFTLLPPDEALIDGLRRYLFERTARERGFRDKTQLVQAVRRQFRDILRNMWGAPGVAMLKDRLPPVPGEPSPFQFDITVANGRAYFSAQAISFEGPETRRLDKEIWSTAWLIQGVRKQIEDFPIAVVVAPPLESNDVGDVFERATNQFESLGANVLKETEVAQWANERSKQLATYLQRPF